MKTCFPARKVNGEDYANLKEIMTCIGREPHGSWLAGTNHMWHGGIHLTEVTAPGAVLSEEKADKAVPLQCMADGEIVAWRINRDYLTGDYLSRPYQYSTTFLLVRSPFQADSAKPESGLDIYSLYTGLAPVSDFPVYKVVQARETVLMYKAGSYAGSESADGVATVPEQSGRLSAGSRVRVLKEGRFSNNGVVQPFGLAKLLNDKGEACGNTFWVTLLPEYMAEASEQRTHLPAWMQQAVTHGAWDSVVVPSSPVHISVGDAVGFLAADIAPAGRGKTSASYFAHIEVLSVDPRMPDFLTNPGNTDTGTRFIRLGLHKPLYLRTGDTFAPMGAITERDGGKLLELDKCQPIVSGGKTWYQIRSHTWMSQDDVGVVRQFDLAEREFSALTENTISDMKNSLKAGWVRDGLIKFAERMNPEKGMRQGMMSRYYKGMVDKLDTDYDGMLSPRELYVAVHHSEMGIRKLASRLVVKHDSEWFGGSSHHKWETFFQNYDVLRVDYAKKWLDDNEWMSQVPAFSSGAAVWHMHPVVFLDAIAASSGCITLAMLRKIWTSTANVSDELLLQVAEELNANLDLCHLNTEERLYHFMAQVYQETGPKFSITESLNYASPALPIFFSYYRRHPTEQELDGRTAAHPANQMNIANKAYGSRNGNNMPDDGWRYRGRGMKQLTGRGNYKRFTEYSASKWNESTDFVSKPELLVDNIKYAVRSALFFWDDGKMYLKADEGYSLEASIGVTNIINSGLSLSDKKVRFNNLEEFLNKKIFQGVF